jgi:hypothetical protein
MTALGFRSNVSGTPSVYEMVLGSNVAQLPRFARHRSRLESVRP